MERSFRINELAKVTRSSKHSDWMVKMLGPLSRDRHLETESKVDVLLKPTKRAGSKKSLRGIGEQVVQVGVGQLPILQMGSIWINGELHDDKTPNSVHTESFEIVIPENGRQKQVIATEVDDVGRPYVNVSDWRLPESFLPSKFVVMPATSQKGDSVELVIPVYALIQAYFAQSSTLSRSLFDFLMGSQINSLVKIDECGLFNPEALSPQELNRQLQRIRGNFGGMVGSHNIHRVFVVKLRPQMSNEEGYVLARLLNDPFAHSVASNIGNSCMTSSSMAGPQGIYPNGWFPFIGKSVLTAKVYQKPIVDVDGLKRVMVLAIKDCSYRPSDYDFLLVDRTSDGSKADPKTDNPDEEKKPSNWNKQSRKKSKKKKRMQSDSDSDKDQPVEDVDIPFLNGIGSQGIRLITRLKEKSEFKNKPFPVIPPKGGPDSGTSSGKANKSGIRRTNLNTFEQDTENRRKAELNAILTASLESFAKILMSINEAEDFQANVRRGHLRPGAYPAVTKTTDDNDWALIEPGRRYLRYFMVGDIVYNKHHYILLDPQRRKVKGSTKESFLYEVVRKKRGSSVLDAELSLLIDRVCQAKGRMKNIEKMPPNFIRTWRAKSGPRAPVSGGGESGLKESRVRLFGLQHRSTSAERTAERVMEHILSHESFFKNDKKNF